MSTTSLFDVVQLFSSADDGDTDIANAVMSGEMDLATAIEELAELDDAELKKQLVSAAIVGGFTLLDRKRKSRSSASETAESDDTDDSVETDDLDDKVTVDVDEDDEATDESDEETSSRLVTLPRLAFVGIAAGVAYAVVKYRQSGADDTAQSTFDDVSTDDGHDAGLAVDDKSEEEDEDAETEEVLAEDDVVDEAADDEVVDDTDESEEDEEDEDESEE